MSKVQRYYVGKYGLVEGEELGRLSVVLAADFNLVAAERDQLQRDLTERDELIDQLRSGYVFETGPYEVELSEAQWSAALGVFENYNMGDDRHLVFLEEQGRGVISEILIEIGVARAPDADEVSE